MWNTPKNVRTGFVGSASLSLNPSTQIFESPGDISDYNRFLLHWIIRCLFDQGKKGGSGGGGNSNGNKKDDSKRETQYAHHNHGDKHFHDKYHAHKPIPVKESKDDHIGEELFHLLEEEKKHKRALHHQYLAHPQTGAVH